MSDIYLVCNAHIDPVWLWEWEEGAAAAISTFRTAADLCEEFGAFVFNHNEALLYRWVEEYESSLFERIRALVAAGRWRIMGGWYLQPDCNMPSGESITRQILEGRRYFRERFGDCGFVEPTAAVNFDPFGHNRGLVQILAKSGYSSYLFCRPGAGDLSLSAEDFTWLGFDGSTVIAHRALEFYNSPLGKAVEKLETWLEKRGSSVSGPGMMLWGIGDHGGGPSRRDLVALGEFFAKHPELDLRHGSPEDYFASLAASCRELPTLSASLNPWAIGCYTSQARIKQGHRALEAALYSTEKLAAGAAMQGLIVYPEEELREAERDLLFSEFHDILPGSSIKAVEETSLRLMDHGLEILSRTRARAFFALCRGQEAAAPGEIPVLVANPHPWTVTATVSCEFQLEDQNYEESWSVPRVYRDGLRLPSQLEQEASNLNLDWRKRVVFRADLGPGTVSRFDCMIESLPRRPIPTRRSDLLFEGEDMSLRIDVSSGLVASYRVGGCEFLKPGAFALLALRDDEDPWAMRVRRFGDLVGQFGQSSPPRLVEDGEVRSVVEARFGMGSSRLLLRYLIPKRGAAFEVEAKVLMAEKNLMLKLAVPTSLEDGGYWGQGIYGREALKCDGEEVVAQSWTAVVGAATGGAAAQALSILNRGSYGSDFAGGEARLSLLRTPAYSAHPIASRLVIPEGRGEIDRIDQGERSFRFRIEGGLAQRRLELVEREALEWNEEPFALSFFPAGLGERTLPSASITGDDAIVLTALKKVAGSERYVLHLFEPTGQARRARIELPALGLKADLSFSPFELKTLIADPAAHSLVEAGLLDELSPAAKGP